jgi:hypothetical protein
MVIWARIVICITIHWTYTMTHPEATTLCYRYHAWADYDYDDESIWAFVQRHNGYISIRQDSIDYYVPRAYQCLFELAYPGLARQPGLDYI